MVGNEREGFMKQLEAMLAAHPHPAGSDREAEFDRFVADLRLAAD